MFRTFWQWLLRLFHHGHATPDLKPAPLADQLTQLPPLAPNRYELMFTDSHLHLMLQLKQSLQETSVDQLRQNLAQMPQGTSIQLYLDYFDRIFTQIDDYQVTYNVFSMLNGTLVQFVWPKDIQQGVEKLHNEVLPHLLTELKPQLPEAVQAQFQDNYDRLMADYDLSTWLELVLNSYQPGWEYDYKQAMSQYLEMDADDVEFNHNYFGYSAQVNLINPLLLRIQSELTDHWFKKDPAVHDLQTQIEITANPEGVLDWLMIFGWLPWLRSQNGFLDYQSLIELKIGLWSHVLNNQFDDFDLLKSLLGANLEADRGMGHQVSSYQVKGSHVIAKVDAIEFDYQSILQSAVERLQDLPAHVNVFEAQLRLFDPELFDRLLTHHDQAKLQIDVDRDLIERFNVNYAYRDQNLLATHGQTRMVVTTSNCWLTTIDFQFEHPEPVLYVVKDWDSFFTQLWQTMIALSIKDDVKK